MCETLPLIDHLRTLVISFSMFSLMLERAKEEWAVAIEVVIQRRSIVIPIPNTWFLWGSRSVFEKAFLERREGAIEPVVCWTISRTGAGHF